VSAANLRTAPNRFNALAGAAHAAALSGDHEKAKNITLSCWAIVRMPMATAPNFETLDRFWSENETAN